MDKYTWVLEEKNNHFIVVKDRKFGFINKNDIEICPIKYDYAYDFKDGFAKVKLNGIYFYIDETGREIYGI